MSHAHPRGGALSHLKYVTWAMALAEAMKSQLAVLEQGLDMEATVRPERPNSKKSGARTSFM
jgi:hypothetical protein